MKQTLTRVRIYRFKTHLQNGSHRGFTLVELLIVIVVIAILAAIAVNVYAGVQDKAKAAKVTGDVETLERAVLAARIQTGKTLREITGSGCTRCICPYTTPYNTLSKTHLCWVQYYSALDSISVASGSNLEQLKAGDPWNSPYMIDENEGEQVANPCLADSIRSHGKSSSISGGTSLGSINIRFSLPECI